MDRYFIQSYVFFGKFIPFLLLGILSCLAADNTRELSWESPSKAARLLWIGSSTDVEGIYIASGSARRKVELYDYPNRFQQLGVRSLERNNIIWIDERFIVNEASNGLGLISVREAKFIFNSTTDAWARSPKEPRWVALKFRDWTAKERVAPSQKSDALMLLSFSDGHEPRRESLKVDGIVRSSLTFSKDGGRLSFVIQRGSTFFYKELRIRDLHFTENPLPAGITKDLPRGSEIITDLTSYLVKKLDRP